MRNVKPLLTGFAIALGLAPAGLAAQAGERQPLEVARVLAERYPANPIMSYIPALSWSGSLRIAALTGEERWKEKPRREMQPFITGEKVAIADPGQLTSLAGHLAFFEAGRLDGNRAAEAMALKAAEFILPQSDAELIRFPRKWTDDMFMATSILAPAAARTGDPRYARVIGRMLIAYAEELQQPDGTFI